MKQIALQITMTLKSDTIFGSGFSIPGGEDLSVLTDGKGQPYLRASTFRGLLRESLQDLLVWTHQDARLLREILGESDWHGFSDGDETRHVRVTDLTMKENTYSSDRWTYLRTFTKMDDGLVADGSLRVVRCIRKGLEFSGELICAEQDRKLIEQALSGIRFVGSMRHRGFGQVRCTCAPVQTKAQNCTITGSGAYIAYRFRLETPLRVTNLRSSDENSYATRQFVEGSMLRGYVCGRLSRENPEFFAAHKKELLSETLFLQALPVWKDHMGIPSVRGYYETKNDAKKQITHILRCGKPPEKSKRASIGSVCSIDEDVLQYWSADIGSSQRISLQDPNETKMFQNDFLSAGQEFAGYIYAPDDELRQVIADCLTGEFWLGAAQHSGFGKCRCMEIRYVDMPEYRRTAVTAQTMQKELYLLLLSPMALRSAEGEVCGINSEMLKNLLGVQIKHLECATALTERGGYNRTWGCALPSLPMYDSGSLFVITTEHTPEYQTLDNLMRRGIGLRRSEGFGQVLFLQAVPETLRKSDLHTQETSSEIVAHAALRRKKIEWIRENRGAFREISASQAGSIQAILEGPDAEKRLLDYLEKNENERGAEHGQRFKHVGKFLRDYLEKPLCETLGMDCSDQDKVSLLIQLLDFSRKGKEDAQR